MVDKVMTINPNKRVIGVSFIVLVLALISWWIVAANIKNHTRPSPAPKEVTSSSTSTIAVKEKINPKDGATMVYVPAGEFLMGSKDGEFSDNEHPQRKVFLDSFWIYKTEVTVAQYRKFCKATGQKMPTEPSWKWQDDNPIVNVSWYDAVAYAKWANTALPTEAQWEKAARGTDGRIYPWGNDWDAAKCVNSTQSTKPVGSIPADTSPYGCLDMAGNAMEWCADWYDAGYYKNAPARNPPGPAVGIIRVLRGGLWNRSNYLNRCSCRIWNYPGNYNYDGGFRCISSVP